MRRSEQYRLRWQDVDLKRNIITLPRSKHGEPRRIQINSIARSALLRLRERWDGIGDVCPGYELHASETGGIGLGTLLRKPNSLISGGRISVTRLRAAW